MVGTLSMQLISFLHTLIYIYIYLYVCESVQRQNLATMFQQAITHNTSAGN